MSFGNELNRAFTVNIIGQHSKIVEFPLGIRYGLDDVQLIQYIVLFGSDSNRAFTVNVQQLLNSPWAYGNTGMFSN